MDEISRIKQFLREERLLQKQVDDDEMSLLESGLIDSLMIIDLTSFMEQEFGIEISEDDLVPENFDSFAAMQRFVTEKRQAG